MYSKGIDAKQRYRRRLKLQAALTRVVQVLARHLSDKIPADRTTALLAAEAVRGLVTFIKAAGLAERLYTQDDPDLQRFADLIKARKKETAARYRRLEKQIRREQAKRAAGPTRNGEPRRG